MWFFFQRVSVLIVGHIKKARNQLAAYLTESKIVYLAQFRGLAVKPVFFYKDGSCPLSLRTD